MRLKPADLKPEVVSIEALEPFPRNARVHDEARLDESISEHGVYRPVVISSDDYVVAGNGTWERAREAGETHIAVTRLPLPHDDPQAVKINLVDNRTNDLASYDEKLRAELLQDVASVEGDLVGTGYRQEDLEKLLASLAEPFFPPAGEDEQGRLDGRNPVTCPNCGHEFQP